MITTYTHRVVYQIKDTIFWKQITTESVGVSQHAQLFIRSKIQFFESKSQLVNIHRLNFKCCLSDQRYNFLKANHNQPPLIIHHEKLFIRSKIQFFESKSQLISSFSLSSFCCLSDQRYNFLKANHNWQIQKVWSHWVVYQIKDTIFWKLFTISTDNQSVIWHWETV